MVQLVMLIFSNHLVQPLSVFLAENVTIPIPNYKPNVIKNLSLCSHDEDFFYTPIK